MKVYIQYSRHIIYLFVLFEFGFLNFLRDLNLNKTFPYTFYGLEFFVMVSLFIFIKKILDGLEKQLKRERKKDKKSHWIKRRI